MQESPIRYRYPGVNYFRREDKDVFCGRDQDAQALYTQVMLSRTVVLHGESGTGKSSLLQAGLLPILEENDPECLTVIIRFDEYKKGDSAAEGTPKNDATLIAQTIQKIRNFNLQLSEGNLPYINQREDNLWYVVKHLNYNKRSVLFVFDQFEEIQGYSNEEIHYFIKELATLFRSEIPADLYNEMQENLAGAFERTDMDATDRNALNKAIKFLESPLNVKILFVVREDKLGIMSLLSDQFPNILKNSYLLRQLTVDNARKAIQDPAGRDGAYFSNKFMYENVDSLLKTLAEAHTNLIDPLQIQIICSNIERTIATKKHLILESDIPSISDIINSFYANCWAEVKKQLNLTNATHDKIRRYYIKELVVNEKRKLVIKDDLSFPEFAGLTEKVITILCTNGLLREIPSGKDSYYQLCHDRFMKPLSIDLMQLNAKKLAEARTTKRLNTVKTIAFIVVGLVLCLWYVYYNQQQQEKTSRMYREAAKAKQDSIVKIREIERNENLLNQLRFNKEKDSVAAYMDSLTREKEKADIINNARFAKLDAQRKLDAAAAEAANAARAAAEADSFQRLKISETKRIKDSMKAILTASDLARIAQQSKTTYEQRIYAWLAYNALPVLHGNDTFIAGVYGALSNAVIDKLALPGTLKLFKVRNKGYVNIEKLFFADNALCFSVPFTGIRNKSGSTVFSDTTMVRSWMDHKGQYLAAVHIDSKTKRKTFVVRKNSGHFEIIDSVSLRVFDDINTVVFDPRKEAFIYSTVPHDRKTPGRVGSISVLRRHSQHILPFTLNTGEIIFLAYDNGLSGMTNTGKYYEWDANYSVAKMKETWSVADKLHFLNSVSYYYRQAGNMFTGDEFGNVYWKQGEEPMRALASETGRVTSIVVSQNNKWVAASFANGTLALWDISIHNAPAFLAGSNACSNNRSSGKFISLAFAKDNNALFAVTEYGAVYQFPISMNYMANEICKMRAELNRDDLRIKNNIPSKTSKICEN